MAEIIVALFFVSMAVMLVGGLSQQVMNLSKSSKQTSAMIELRSKINSLTRNSEDWIHKMRVNPSIGSIYSGCIPDASVVSTSFNCPAVDASILASDAELSRIAGPQMHAARVPIVDSMGEQIAGGDEPVYLDADGQICTREPRATQCAFESTGYMLRTNSAANANPGNVRFVVKVARNLQHVASRGLAAMKPQYMSIDMGTQWSKSLTGSCPSGSLKMGYLASGRPYCVKTMANCPSGQLALGVDSSGAAVCSSAPTSCPAGESAAYDPSTATIKCSAATSPCSNGKVFLGFYAGSQQAICMSADMSCPAGQVQVGFATNGDNVQASCAQVPTCTSSQVVAFNGSAFACSTESEGVLCSDNQVLVGITKAGAPLCEPLVAGRDGVDGVAGRDGVDGTSVAIGQTCPTDQFVAGINNDGSVLCRSPASSTTGGDGNDDGMGFVSMAQLPSFTSGSDDYEKQKHVWPLSCHVTVGAKVYQCGYVAPRMKISGAAYNVATIDKNLESIGSDNNFITSRKCIFIDGKWKMQTSGSRYDRLCTGGIMFKKMIPAASRLDMRAIGHPEFSTEATRPRVIVPKGSMGVAATKSPSLAQLMAYFNACDISVSPAVNADGIADEHCAELKTHIDKAKAYTELRLAPQNYPGLVPQFCQAASKKGYFWTGCGPACGVKVVVDYKAGQTVGTHGYKFKYQWARNYSAPAQGTNFPIGTACVGSAATGSTDRVRLAPSGLEEAIENESEDTGDPVEEL